MKVLLDTHAFVWFVQRPTELPGPTLELLEDPGTEVILSAITPWELATKVRIGRFPYANLVLAYEENVARIRATELPFTSRHATTAGGLDWDHKDPFDRALAAQSIIEQLPLVTGDAAFATLPGLRVVW